MHKLEWTPDLHRRQRHDWKEWPGAKHVNRSASLAYMEVNPARDTCEALQPANVYRPRAALYITTAKNDRARPAARVTPVA